jgi:uncharacterized cofD-like protein
MKKIQKVVTIGGWNGHSNMLSGIHKVFQDTIHLSAVVSMSDDGRTTGRLMRYFYEDIGLHFPPPWDLRRCLYFLSDSEYALDFQNYFEFVLQDDVLISDLSLGDICKIVWIYDLLEKVDFPYFEYTLPIKHSLEWHKFWNIFMWFLFYILWKDYDAMMEYMHKLLQVNARVLPVTTDRAYIQAKLADGTIIEKQDNISNVAGYSSRIIELSLMSDSRDARHQKHIANTITEADYIILSPWDLYTSTISNLIIWWMKDLIAKSHAKIIFVANTTNKWWETTGYSILDFVNELEKYLWKSIDIIIANSAHLHLTEEEIFSLKNNISVKGGEYIYLTESDKNFLHQKSILIIEADLLDRKTLYKHDTIALAKTLEKIILLW